MRKKIILCTALTASTLAPIANSAPASSFAEVEATILGKLNRSSYTSLALGVNGYFSQKRRTKAMMGRFDNIDNQLTEINGRLDVINQKIDDLAYGDQKKAIKADALNYFDSSYVKVREIANSYTNTYGQTNGGGDAFETVKNRAPELLKVDDNVPNTLFLARIDEQKLSNGEQSVELELNPKTLNSLSNQVSNLCTTQVENAKIVAAQLKEFNSLGKGLAVVTNDLHGGAQFNWTTLKQKSDSLLSDWNSSQVKGGGDLLKPIETINDLNYALQLEYLSQLDKVYWLEAVSIYLKYNKQCASIGSGIVTIPEISSSNAATANEALNNLKALYSNDVNSLTTRLNKFAPIYSTNQVMKNDFPNNIFIRDGADYMGRTSYDYNKYCVVEDAIMTGSGRAGNHMLRLTSICSGSDSKNYKVNTDIPVRYNNDYDINPTLAINELAYDPDAHALKAGYGDKPYNIDHLKPLVKVIRDDMIKDGSSIVMVSEQWSNRDSFAEPKMVWNIFENDINVLPYVVCSKYNNRGCESVYSYQANGGPVEEDLGGDYPYNLLRIFSNRNSVGTTIDFSNKTDVKRPFSFNSGYSYSVINTKKTKPWDGSVTKGGGSYDSQEYVYFAQTLSGHLFAVVVRDEGRYKSSKDGYGFYKRWAGLRCLAGDDYCSQRKNGQANELSWKDGTKIKYQVDRQPSDFSDNTVSQNINITYNNGKVLPIEVN